MGFIINFFKNVEAGILAIKVAMTPLSFVFSHLHLYAALVAWCVVDWLVIGVIRSGK